MVTVLAGANRDPRVFDDPARFDVGRANARDHVAFSSGIHFCLGAALARMEGEVALRALFERFPGLASAGTPTRRPTRILRGYESLPVTLGAGVRQIVIGSPSSSMAAGVGSTTQGRPGGWMTSRARPACSSRWPAN